MPYIGNTIRAADDYRLIDDISSGFNGSETSFALQVAGSAPVPFPKSPQQVLISVNGVIQEPDPTGSSGFNLVGTNIVFSSAPTNGHAFFGIIYATADYLNAGGNFPAGALGSPSITFIGDENTGLYRKGSGSVGFVSDATEIANFDSNGITISSGNLIIPDSIIHGGDSDTKIRFPAADTFSVNTAGAERFRIDSSGRVGIGVTNPDRELDISNSSGNCTISLRSSDSHTTQLLFGDVSAELRGRIGYQSSDVLDFYTSAAERMRIDSSGNVGIGTASPSTPLHVVGTIHGSTNIGIRTTSPSNNLHIHQDDSDKSIAQFTNTATGSASGDGFHVGLTSNEDGNLNMKESKSILFKTADTERMRIDSSGQILVGTTSSTSNDGVITGIRAANVSRIVVGNSNTTASGVTGYDMLPSNTVTGARIECRATEDFATTANRTADLGFYTRLNGTLAEKLTILSSGNVGIGTTSPNEKLVVSGNSSVTGALFITSNTSTPSAGAFLYRPASNTLALGSNSSERMRIDSSGRVLIGHTTSTPMDNDANNPIFAVEGTGNGARIAVRSDDTTAGNGAFIYLTRTRGTSAGSKTTVQSGDSLGGFIFMGADGTHDTRAAIIQASCDGTPGDNDMPGRLEFLTTSDGGFNSTERMRITSTGEIRVGNYGTLFGQSGYALYGNATGGPQLVIARSDSDAVLIVRRGTDGDAVEFRKDWGAGGSISVATNSVTYNTSSDYRLKENIVPITDGITRLKTLKPSRFNWIGDTSSTRDGFIAHEVTAVPEAISGTKDETYTEDESSKNIKAGDPKYQGIDQAKLVPLLTAALQEAITKIETLETKVAALETA